MYNYFSCYLVNMNEKVNVVLNALNIIEHPDTRASAREGLT